MAYEGKVSPSNRGKIKDKPLILAVPGFPLKELRMTHGLLPTKKFTPPQSSQQPRGEVPSPICAVLTPFPAYTTLRAKGVMS